MAKEELIQRSPVRVFMESIQGGLKSGELGLVASPSGVGKTSVLVQISLDKLLQGKKIIHVSFTRHTDYVLIWYEDIFGEFTKRKNLENEQDIKNEIVKNRVLMKFSQEGIKTEVILRSIRALIKDGAFDAEMIVIDGYDFSAAEEGHVAEVKAFAVEMGVSVWYSCNVNGKEPLYDKQKTPMVIKESAEHFAVIIILDPKPDYIALAVSKNRDAACPEDTALKLDPKTLLILEK
jgi:hypothetical protein